MEIVQSDAPVAPLADRDAASQPPVMEVVAAAVPPEVPPEAEAPPPPETQPPAQAVPFVDL